MSAPTIDMLGSFSEGEKYPAGAIIGFSQQPYAYYEIDGTVDDSYFNKDWADGILEAAKAIGTTATESALFSEGKASTN